MSEEITIEEQLEIEGQRELAEDIQWLMKNEQFKRVILDKYIKDSSVEVGMSFTGSEEQMDTLKSITSLVNYLTINGQ